MALISINLVKNDMHDEQLNHGHYEVKIIAGLDEAPDAIFQEGLDRIRNIINNIPSEKRYSRLHPTVDVTN